MSTHHATISLPATSADVLDALARPEACKTWCPLPVQVSGVTGERLGESDRMTVEGALAGRTVAFDVKILEATDDRFALRATGVFVIDAAYDVTASGDDGATVSAVVRTSGGRGLGGRVLAAAADRLLSAGLLETALQRIRRYVLDAAPYALA